MYNASPREIEFINKFIDAYLEQSKQHIIKPEAIDKVAELFFRSGLSEHQEKVEVIEREYSDTKTSYTSFGNRIVYLIRWFCVHQQKAKFVELSPVYCDYNLFHMMGEFGDLDYSKMIPLELETGSSIPLYSHVASLIKSAVNSSTFIFPPTTFSDSFVAIVDTKTPVITPSNKVNISDTSKNHNVVGMFNPCADNIQQEIVDIIDKTKQVIDGLTAFSNGAFPSVFIIPDIPTDEQNSPREITIKVLKAYVSLLSAGKINGADMLYLHCLPLNAFGAVIRSGVPSTYRVDPKHVTNFRDLLFFSDLELNITNTGIDLVRRVREIIDKLNKRNGLS